MSFKITRNILSENLLAGIKALNCVSTSHELTSLPAGGNNRVFRLLYAGRSYLLKQYFLDENDQRDRLKHEFSFLTFAWNQNIRNIPEPVACDYENRLGLYEFIDGRSLKPAEIGREHIRQTLDFYMALNRIKKHPNARMLPRASDACFSLEDHSQSVERRLSRFQNLAMSDAIAPEAMSFIHSELVPRWSVIKETFTSQAAAEKISFVDKITDEECCLSPSDFGFHNFLLVEDGSLRFIDFEYAGWDDPAKLACDFCSQPELPVPPALAQFFIEGLSAVSSEPDSLKLRINLLLPVYRIKWCFIILNDFLPESDRRRAFAGSDSPDRRRRIQLQKAEKYLKA